MICIAKCAAVIPIMRMPIHSASVIWSSLSSALILQPEPFILFVRGIDELHLLDEQRDHA